MPFECCAIQFHTKDISYLALTGKLLAVCYSLVHAWYAWHGTEKHEKK